MPGLDPGIPSTTAPGDCRARPGNDDAGHSVAGSYFFSNTSLATSAAVIAAGQPA